MVEWHRKDRADDSAREDSPSNNLGVLHPSAFREKALEPNRDKFGLPMSVLFSTLGCKEG